VYRCASGARIESADSRRVKKISGEKSSSPFFRLIQGADDSHLIGFPRPSFFFSLFFSSLVLEKKRAGVSAVKSLASTLAKRTYNRPTTPDKYPGNIQTNTRPFSQVLQPETSGKPSFQPATPLFVPPAKIAPSYFFLLPFQDDVRKAPLETDPRSPRSHETLAPSEEETRRAQCL